MDQVSQVQFFPRDICTPLSKENAYLYYIAGGSDREPFQMFARRASFEKVSESDIVEQVKNKIKATSSISSLAKVWKMLDDVRETYPQSLIRKLPRYLPQFKVTTTDMCGTNYSKVDRLLVWEMNRLSPVLTGYYFESMLARVLGVEHTEDIKNILKGKDVIIAQDDFVKMIKRRGIKEDSLLYQALVSYLKLNDFTEDVSDAVSNLQEYIEKNKKELDEYMKALSNTWITNTMKREMNLEHSKFVEDTKLGIRGEMDFVSNTYITDCKCYKQDDYKAWAGQLYLYRKILKNDCLKLRIINFNTNTVYEFFIMQDGEEGEESDEDDEDEGSVMSDALDNF